MAHSQEAQQALAQQHAHQQQAQHALLQQQALHQLQAQQALAQQAQAQHVVAQQALAQQQAVNQHQVNQVIQAFREESMKLSGELLRLGNATRSVRARENTTHDAEMQARIQRQADEIEDLKQKVKQPKQELTQDIKVIEKQPNEVEEIKEKRAHFLDAVELTRQVDELQQEVQQFKKVKGKH